MLKVTISTKLSSYYGNTINEGIAPTGNEESSSVGLPYPSSQKQHLDEIVDYLVK